MLITVPEIYYNISNYLSINWKTTRIFTHTEPFSQIYKDLQNQEKKGYKHMMENGDSFKGGYKE